MSAYERGQPRDTAHRGRRDDMQHENGARSDRTQTRYSPPRRTPPYDISQSAPRASSGNQDYRRDGRREWDSRRDRLSDERDNYRSQPRSDSRSPPRRFRGGYRDRDGEGYRSPRRSSRSRSRSGSPRRRTRERSPYYGGLPSREIMMDGLPQDMKEEDIRHELQKYHKVGTLEDVRIIKDKKTGASRQFGFLKFAEFESAKAFMEQNHPLIYLYGNESSDSGNEAAKVRIAYSREREDPRAEQEWKCRVCSLPNYRRGDCVRCKTPRTEVTATGDLTHNKPSHFTNTGDSDVSPTASQYLLLRGLEPTVSEDLLAKGVAKLYKSSGGSSPTGKGAAKIVSTTSTANLGASVDSILRVLLVRDRRTNESWRYGFAEFKSVDDAQAALTKFNSQDRFTIASKPVMASFIHAGVFVPVFNVAPGGEQYVFGASSNPSLKLAYWDEEAYVTELTVAKPADTTAGKLAADKAASIALAEREGLVPAGKDGEKSKKRKAESSSQSTNKKATPSHLQFWTNRHAEIHGIKHDKAANQDANGADGEGEAAQEEASTADAQPPARSYADMTKKCCYLCSRQFKTEAEVNKHERMSDLHRNNLKNDELKTKALAKLSKSSTPQVATPEATEAPEYRDRAKERRAAFNQPKKPAAQVPGSQKSSSPAKEVKADEEEDDEDMFAPAPSKGAALLGKMGWSEGKGLGASGTGIAAPIATDMYVAGVGLGAKGGKVGDAVEEAQRNTAGGYEAWLEKGRQTTKERYENM